MDSAIIIGRAQNAAQQSPVLRRNNNWQDECATITADKAKRRRRLSRKRRMLLITAILVPAYLGAGGWWLARSGTLEKTEQSLSAWLFAHSTQAGFAVKTIRIEGLKTLSPELVTKAANLQLGEAMLGLSLKDIRIAIESLPEVRDAKVRRQFPDSLTISITERVPSAIWVSRGKTHWLDRDGTVLVNQSKPAAADDLRLIGKDAPENTPALLTLLESQPALRPLVATARRVGGRRWDVVLRPGLLIKLPETNAQQAWDHLAALFETEQLAARAVKVIDMRIEDRIFMTPEHPILPAQHAPNVPSTDVEGGHDA